MILFELTVYGTQQPSGSKKGFARRGKDGKTHISIVDASPKARPWKDLISREAAIAMKGHEILRGPLYAEFRFFRQRPRSHFNSKGEVKESAPKFPTTRPDVLKTARSVEDSLTGCVYLDDAQICAELLMKCYGHPERVEIVIKDAAQVGLLW